MRAPDFTAEIAPDAPALAWAGLANAAVQQFAKIQGIPQAHVDMAQAETAKAVAALGTTVNIWKVVGKPSAPDHAGSLAQWVVNGPYNLLWQWWMIGVIHLRPIAGVKAPNIRVEGATHEILIASIDPSIKVNIDRLESGKQHLKYLTPIDLVYQPVGLTDAQAVELGGLMVDEILTGTISPDQDWRSTWEANLDSTVEHIRYGGHPQDN